MITKAVRQHGSRVRGVVEYLFGPGRAEEHTNPHVIAAHAGLLVGEQGATPFARKVLAGELDAYRVALAPEVTERFVFHAAVSIAAEDGPLAEETWRDVAETIAAHLGFTPDTDEDPEVRWVAVHHGLSSNGNDHIHLVANLINSDGRKHRFPRPPGVMLGEVRKTLEIRHGLRQVGHTNGVDHGTGLGGHTRAEVERAAREQRSLSAGPGGPGSEAALVLDGGTPAPGGHRAPVLEPESVRLERAVRAAASAASTEADFVTGLREQRVIVRPRMAAGSRSQVVGYSVALPTGGGGEHLLWFGGGRLAKDLTLPALRAVWEHGQDDAAGIAAARQAAVAAWSSRGPVGEQRDTGTATPVRRDVAADLEATRRRISNVGAWASTVGTTDPAVAREAARATAGLLAAAATRLPPHEQVPFHAAARALARLGQPDRAGLRTVPGGQGTDHGSGPRVMGAGAIGAALLGAATGSSSRAGWIAVYQALATTTTLVTIANRSTEAARAEQDAAEVAARKVMALTGAGTRTAAGPRNLDTSFPIPLHEQIAHVRRTEQRPGEPPRGPVQPFAPGRDRDTGPVL
ncbi:hypothetical protein GCM10027047_39460 [Rhodococcus aerolatus]